MAAVRVVSLEKANSGMPYSWKSLDSDELEMESLEVGRQKMYCSEASVPVSLLRSSR